MTDRTGVEYRGKTSITKTGKKCQTWYFQYPHKNDDYKKIPDGAWHNFCRNPDDAKKGPWCLTNDMEVRWEYCDVKVCENELKLTPIEQTNFSSATTTILTTSTSKMQVSDQEHSFFINFNRKPLQNRENIDCVINWPAH